jgi:pimeloyl-ACP methyl ester carboxylesterase
MRANSAGVGIEYDVAGEGAPVVLLHGWPDTAALWRRQTAALSAAGLRALAPDLRGFGRSDKPERTADYAIHHHVSDVLAVLDDAGIERAHVVGHDWGAAIAWALAMAAPERVDHLVALSVGHPAAFRRAGLAQLRRSWYMGLFQLPGIAERALSAGDWNGLRRTGHPDVERVIAELSRPGAVTASLQIYRANAGPQQLVRGLPEMRPVTVPTMGVWSTRDAALTERQMVASGPCVRAPWRYERLEGPGHWMQLEAPDAVNRLLLDFLAPA